MSPIGDPANVFLTDIQHHGVLQTRDGLATANLTSDQIYTLEAVSLTFATASVIFSFLAFYWFVRMRRSFRQDLIMLLIQSDMMKAFWLMVCPIIYFISGPIRTETAFCQVSAFFLTAAIESADIAVLMIAIHSALYIFRPRRSGGETGLYPYRRYAYALWFVLPILLAAIVPITGGHFVDTGPHCYLPTKPLWYRTSLSWIPRYIIFGVIFLVYGWVYLYVGCRFRRLQQDQRRASTHSCGSAHKERRNRREQIQDVPPTPPIVHHGLREPSPSRIANTKRDRQQSAVSDVSSLTLDDEDTTSLSLLQEARQENCLVSWNWVEADYNDTSQSHFRRERSLSNLVSPTLASFTAETPEDTLPSPIRPALCHQTPPVATQSNLNGQSVSRSISKPVSMRHSTTADSLPSLRGILHRGPPRNSDNDAASSSPSVYLTQSTTEAALRKSRDRMRRQLRLLFIYPLIYVAAWIAPFISHVYRYDDDDDASQPFALLLMNVASLCLGAAIDCCFFSAWEKPWRHLRGGFWEGLARRLKLRPRRRIAGGRTREEELRDATAAIQRRTQEDMEHQATAALERSRPIKRLRQWWDAEDGQLESQSDGITND
ncbi:G protein-coupled glucose receptor regulating Gpa2-domain-containing protein [Xylariales sp. AK1849]|nr:G protein-coupled glucose receptor regulating Gpa2-domain-containing protein [Xylariales sp. AK1849]